MLNPNKCANLFAAFCTFCSNQETATPTFKVWVLWKSV